MGPVQGAGSNPQAYALNGGAGGAEGGAGVAQGGGFALDIPAPFTQSQLAGVGGGDEGGGSPGGLNLQA